MSHANAPLTPQGSITALPADRGRVTHCPRGLGHGHLEALCLQVVAPLSRVWCRWAPRPLQSTHALTRHDLNRLSHIDRQSGREIRRYERERPGELVHVDVKKLGKIPPGGGHKIRGRAAS